MASSRRITPIRVGKPTLRDRVRSMVLAASKGKVDVPAIRNRAEARKLLAGRGPHLHFRAPAREGERRISTKGKRNEQRERAL